MKLESFVKTSISGEMNLEAQKAFLLELNEQGFSGDDIAALIGLFYEQMPEKLHLPGAIDLCGTGGSGLQRINTSTLTAFVLAAAGVPVAKHGNKAASGRFGSFDLLETLGINIMADKNRLESIYKDQNLAFIFARSFHPVFKHFAAVRQELRVKTIFNILGPLLNPANPEYQIIGTSNPKDMQLIAEAALALGKKQVLVINGSDGLDELTLTGKTSVMEVRNGKIDSYKLEPADFGFEMVDFSQIAGGDQAFNIGITKSILDGSCTTAHINLVLANTALALKFMGQVKTYKEGVAVAREVIDQGLARQLLERYSQLSNAPDILLEIAEHKRTEVAALKTSLPLQKIRSGIQSSDRDFKGALARCGELKLIAEIKKASPSEKQIYKGTFSTSEIATLYEKSGADAISVLTDEKYFEGSLENLKQARGATEKVPLLMKDFFIDEYQIYLARYCGADAILLITALLTEEQISTYIEITKSLGMDVLLEVHNQRELDIALKSKAEIIGVNNRDLHTFEIDTKTFIHLFSQIPDTKISVAESGYTLHSANQVLGFANAVLIGSSIMRSDNMGDSIRRIKTPRKKFKACGIRTLKDARYCDDQGIAFVGLNFVPSSRRRIEMETAKTIASSLKNSYSVGIFQDQAAEEVNQIAREIGLDFVQLSGSETVAYCREIELPVIKTLKVKALGATEDYAEVVDMFIVDGATPGSGEGYDYSKLKDFHPHKPFLVAGGVNPDNARIILSILPGAAGLHAASGIETESLVDTHKINEIVQAIVGE